MTATDDPALAAYRSVVAAPGFGDPDVSEDRVRIARLEADGFDTVRALLARTARVERALVPVAAELTAERTGPAAMALSAVAAGHAAVADGLARYWARVVDGEEHARGNSPTGLDDDRWADGLAPVTALGATPDDAGDADPADYPGGTAGRYLLGALLADGLTGLLGATVDGSAAEVPTLPGLAAGVGRVREGADARVRAVTTVAGETAVESVTEPAVALRAVLPAAPAAVSVTPVVEDAVTAYHQALTRAEGPAEPTE